MKIIIALLFILISCISFSQDSLKCPDVKSGYYGYDGELKSTIIFRKKDYQIEYTMNDDHWLIMSLDWVSDCECNITFFEVSRTSSKPLIGVKGNVVITSHNNKGYTYDSIWSNEPDFVLKGNLYYRNQVPKKIKKKMKKILRKNA
jgi:hypothetical protein